MAFASNNTTRGIMQRPALARTAVLLLFSMLSGCVSGIWDVTDDPALPKTGWVKGQTYQLQRTGFILEVPDNNMLYLDFPDFWDKTIVPNSMEEFRKRKSEFGDDIVGVLEKGSLVRPKAFLLDKNPESGDLLLPVGEVVSGEFRGRLVNLSHVSGFDRSSGEIEYRTIGEHSSATIRSRDPKVFVPVGPTPTTSQ